MIVTTARATTPGTIPALSGAPVGRGLAALRSVAAALLGPLAIGGPVSMDLYLPGGPLATGLTHLPLPALMASMSGMVSGIAVTTPPTPTLRLLAPGPAMDGQVASPTPPLDPTS